MSATAKRSPRRAPTPAATVQTHCVCYSCHEVIDIAPIRLACSHTYCEECLAHCFRAGLSSIVDFPPNCCGQELCVHQYKHLLPADTIKKYLELLEQSLRNKDILCAGQNCQRQRIKSYYIKDKWGLCPKCLEYTCTQCHQLQSKHESTDEGRKSKQELSAHPRKCPPNEDAELFKLAQDRNWRTCPHCNAMVSRSEGCNDMRCRCGRKFCYTCGTTYEGRRTCSCPMTFEPHLHGLHVPRDEQGWMDEARRLAARLRGWEPNPRMAGMVDHNVTIDGRRATPDLMPWRARREYLEAGSYLEWARAGPRQSAVEADILHGPYFGGSRLFAPVQHQRPARTDILSDLAPAVDRDSLESLSPASSIQDAHSRHAGLAETQARGRQLEDRYLDVIRAGHQSREVGYIPRAARALNSNDAELSGLPSWFSRREASARDNSDLDDLGYPLGHREATADRDHEIDLLDLPYAAFNPGVAVNGRTHSRRPQPPTQRPARPRIQSPDYHAMLTCRHTNVMSAGAGLCHGCLQRRTGRQMCRACLTSFCAPCLSLSRSASSEDNME